MSTLMEELVGVVMGRVDQVPNAWRLHDKYSLSETAIATLRVLDN